MHRTAILGLYAQTSIHAGAGQSVGGVDLPIQREGHTDWPCIFGSAMKGALRTRAEACFPSTNGKPARKVQAVFGPDTEHASEHAGALNVGDARLLLLPVRSLTGHFKWVTCPEILRRFARDVEFLGLQGAFGGWTLPKEPLGDDSTLVPKEAASEESIYLEEYRLQCRPTDLGSTIDALARLVARDDAKTVLKHQLAVVGNGLFRDLARIATPINAHIALDSDTKTTRDGALWYEETLPPDTLLYVPLMAASERRGKNHKDDDKKPMEGREVLATITELFDKRPWLQVGGNETVGMGWCHVKPLVGGNPDETGGEG
ncbi:MAG: type III-B CRISPR module RAMP protein Cmr4 [Gammaproteobacteria bacterium]|nr:type III-B CRISPR module RAMP protein Cmr4 [Gammaproteobacteria bacterium]